MSRRMSGLIWKTALENADLPERLPYLSELAWINLVFSPHCHVRSQQQKNLTLAFPETTHRCRIV